MRNPDPGVPQDRPLLSSAGSKAPSPVWAGERAGLSSLHPPWPGLLDQACGGSRTDEGSWRCDVLEESLGPSSHGNLSFAVGAQVPGSAARAAVKARGLRTEGFGQLLHAELAPGRVARPPGSRRGLSRQVAAVGGPSRAAGGPGLAVARPDRADGGFVARRSPGADVEQRRQVLGRPRGPRREGQRGGC